MVGADDPGERIELGLRLSDASPVTLQLMRPVIERARMNPKRVVYSEGEDERVLRAAQSVVDDGIARPILVGQRPLIIGGRVPIQGDG